MDLPPVGDVDVSHCVGFRQIDAGAAITHHLLARGRRSIVFGGAQLDERVMQHLYGWRKALEEAGCHDPAL